MKTYNAVLGATSIVIGIAVAVFLLEVVLRFLPVNEQLLASDPITEENPLIRMQRNAEVTFSRGLGFDLVNMVKTNNYGFVSDTDYDPTQTSPLLVIVGDSFVEAAMVPYSETITGRLERELQGVGRVYAFGASGSPLSQYLAYAAYARDTFKPEAMIIVVVGNDFDESLWKYKRADGFHYFTPRTGGGFDLSLHPWRPTHATWLHALGSSLGLGKLALSRHLRTNIGQVEQLLQNPFGNPSPTNFVGQTSASADPERIADSLAVTDEFLARIPEASGLERDRIVFILDGMRPHLYDPEQLSAASDSYFSIMRDYFIGEARELGHSVVDMQPIFLQRHQATKERFEYPTDGHWNSLGHQLAAESVLSNLPKALHQDSLSITRE